jgi:hypothetical protein
VHACERVNPGWRLLGVRLDAKTDKHSLRFTAIEDGRTEQTTTAALCMLIHVTRSRLGLEIQIWTCADTACKGLLIRTDAANLAPILKGSLLPSDLLLSPHRPSPASSLVTSYGLSQFCTASTDGLRLLDKRIGSRHARFGCWRAFFPCI